MPNISDLKKVFDAIPQALAICTLVYENDKFKDVKMDYTNSHFKELFGNTIKDNSLLSEVKDKLSSEIDWFDLLKRVYENDERAESVFYSFLAKCHLKMTVNKVDEKCVVFSIQDITKDFEAEQRLRRQNERLAALTEELSVSRADLQSRFTGMQALNEQLRFSAYYDPLTTLLNRASLIKNMSAAIEEANADGSKFGLLFMDIDNLKNINDSKGHNAGDEILIKLGSIMHAIETNSISCYRFASDEFYILMRGIKTKQPLINVGKNFCKKLNDMGIGVSGGVVMYPDDAISDDELLKYTDIALCEAKKKGKNQICDFEGSMKEEFIQRINIESKLSKAMQEKLFQLYYQPQFDVETGALRGFEALLRWHDDDLGWVSPGKFIPLAEEARLVIPIGDWVFDSAIITLSQWETEKNFNGVLSINVSPLQFMEKTFVSKLKDKVMWSKVNPKHLELEISEDILSENLDSVMKKLNEIRDIGISISLDNFGTGYSSIRFLKLLPVSTLKIGRSFIQNITIEGNKDTDIAKSIMSLLTDMGLETIAEGVETENQLEALKSFNCNNVKMQGFLKGKPMPKYLCDKYLSGDDKALLTNANDKS